MADATTDQPILESLRRSMERGEPPRAALDALMVRYRSRVYAVCFRFLGNHHDAEDALQEVFVRAYKALPRFRGDASLYTWLFRISANTCLSLRSRRRRHDELPEAIVDPRPSAIERLGESEEQRLLHSAVARLPEKQRITLILRAFEERPYREISEILECPVGTAKANYFFALKNLRKLIAIGFPGLVSRRNTVGKDGVTGSEGVSGGS